MATSPNEQIRLAELVAAISLATDLGTGQPMEHALRSCHLSMGLARDIDATVQELSDTYYVSLLRFLGCTAEASADAALNAGEDVALYEGLAPSFMGGNVRGDGLDAASPRRGQPPLMRGRAVLGALADPKGAERAIRAHCEVGEMLARRIGLGASVLAHLVAPSRGGMERACPMESPARRSPLPVT